jgi:hypothetical protein
MRWVPKIGFVEELRGNDGRQTNEKYWSYWPKIE